MGHKHTTNFLRKTRICATCRSEKSFSEYHKNKTQPGGISHHCKVCQKIKSAYNWKNKISKDEKKVQHKNKYRRNWRKDNPERVLWLNARSRARKRGWEFNIDLEDVKIPQFCPVLGIKLSLEEGVRGDNNHRGPSIDRIDSTKGYIKGNIKIISWRANSLKKNGTIEEFERVLQYMKVSLRPNI